MADTFYKPQTPLHIKDKFIYPLTTADQVIKSDGSRLEQNGNIIADSVVGLDADNINNALKAAQEAKADVEVANNNIGDLNSLNTTNKTTLVNAINEVNNKELVLPTTPSNTVGAIWIE